MTGGQRYHTLDPFESTIFEQMADCREYQKMKECSPDLKVAIQDHLDDLVDVLLAKDLISEDNAGEIRNSKTPHFQRAGRLLDIIRNRVKTNFESYYVFINVLKKRTTNYGHILEIRK